MKKIKFKFILSLTLILALALPLFLMPINAAEEEPNIDELIEMTKESELFLSIFFNYQKMVTGEAYQLESEEVEFAKKMGYYDPEFDVGKSQGSFSCVNLTTGEIVEGIRFGYGHKFPDAITVERVRDDVKKYFVSDFLEILYADSYDVLMMTARCYLGTDGHMYNHFFGQFGVVDYVYGIPNFETVRIKEKSNNKITLEFDKIAKEYFEEWGLSPEITIQYTKTQRGWRISGATGGYYNNQDSIFAPEIPETADNSVVYIALASVSVVGLAGATLVSANKKKEYIA